MPFAKLEDACPVCKGTLYYGDTKQHPDRAQYDIHGYACRDCGPVVQIVQLTDVPLVRWINTRPEEASNA